MAPHRFRVPDADAGRRLDAVVADLPEVGTRALAERLVTGGDVLVDGRMLFSKQAEGRFPEDGEILARLR